MGKVAEKGQTYKEPTYSAPAYNGEYYQPIGDDERKRQERTNTPEHNTDKNGYMAKPGQPRQPKKHRSAKKGTLRYEEETATWNCTKCEKSFAHINERSAIRHAEEHTKAERKQKEQSEKQLLHHYAQQNQDEVRLRTMRHYGQEHREVENYAGNEQAPSNSNKNNGKLQEENDKTHGNKNPERQEMEMQQTEQHEPEAEGEREG